MTAHHGVAETGLKKISADGFSSAIGSSGHTFVWHVEGRF